MTGLLYGPVPDSPDVVHSSIPGYYYLAPDIESVDAVLTELRSAIKSETVMLDRRRAFKADFDRLLEHRFGLRMLGEAA